MNFTREPIIETIITPRDGCRLIVRSSKSNASEEFAVDAVEVVSFGQALFFRSLERPRPFLVPVTDYEVLEAKENRVVLKNAKFERTIKIAGGREGSLRKEEEIEEEEESFTPALEEDISEEPETPTSDRKRDRKRDRNRRRRHHEERSEEPQEVKPAAEEPSRPQEPKPEISAFPHLIPPPTSLISQNIHRYKEYQTGAGSEPSKPTEEPTPIAPPEPEGDSTPISRVAIEPPSNNFTSLNDWSNFLT